jgi:hypothetical protein
VRFVQLPHGFFNFDAYWRAQEYVSKLRIELGSAPILDRSQRFAEAPSMAVTPPVSDSVERVGDCHDSRHQGNSSSLQAARVSLAIPSLVVGGYSSGEVGKESLQRSQDLGASVRVSHHGSALLGSKLRVLVKDIGQGSVQLADVVEESDPLDAS